MNRSINMRVRGWAAAMAVSGLLSSGAWGANVLQTFFVPLPEDEMQITLNAIDAYRGNIGDEMQSAISMVVGTDSTILYYDHWEDGFEEDITAPTQTTSQVWGDGDPANGTPPGFPDDLLNAGDVVRLESTIDVTRNSVVIEYDGRDKVGTTYPIAMTRAMYAVNPGEVLAEAMGAFDIGSHGTLYRAPVGVGTGTGNGTNSMFSYSAFYVMADYDFTRIDFDKDNDGAFEETIYLDEGEAYFVNGGILAGATVRGTQPFQCHLVTGDVGSTYEMRWFELWPDSQWGTDYFTPVGTRTNAAGTTVPSLVYLFNPNAETITVSYVTTTNSGTLTVNPNSVYDVFQMPLNGGARFSTTNGSQFLGVNVFDTTVGGGTLYGYVQHCQTYDWGIGLMPVNMMSTMGVVGWGPGYGTTGTGANGNPIWLSAISNTTIYVDYDSDPDTGSFVDPLGNLYDVATNVTALQLVQLVDPTDDDQTGMRFYTLNGAVLMAAWGEDPARADTGNPYLDMGYAIPAFPTVISKKFAALLNDVNGNGYADSGDTIEYTIDIINVGFATANNVIFQDDLPTNVTAYVTNSAYAGGAPAPDSLPPKLTRFPFDEGGYNVGTVALGSTTTVRYVTQVLTNLPADFDGYIHNNATVGGTNGNWSGGATIPVRVGGLSILKQTSTADLLEPGDNFTYTVTVANTGAVTYTGINVEDALPLGVSYVSNSAMIQISGAITNTVADRFNLRSFTNSNGTIPWLAAWAEIGETDGVAAGGVQVMADGTNGIPLEAYALRIGNASRGATRQADLSGHGIATLSFNYRRSGLDGATDAVGVYISSNNWVSSNLLVNLQGAANDTNFLSTNFTVSAYISTNTGVRFLSTATMGAADYVWFDNVAFTLAGTNATFAGTPPPTLAQNLTLPPGGTATVTFAVQVLNPPVATQAINQARVRADQEQSWIDSNPVTNAIHATEGVTLLKTSSTTNLLVAGTNVAYTILISNTGTVTQTGIQLEDLLPYGMTYSNGTASLYRPFVHTNESIDWFDRQAYTNSDGNVAWAGDWVEIGDDGDATNGNLRLAVDGTSIPGQTYALRTVSTSVLQRAASLAGYTTATLWFDYRRVTLDAGDFVNVNVSSNGGATFTQVGQIGGATNDGSYRTTSFNISAYATTGTVIRFGGNATRDGSDIVWLDNIRIAASAANATNALAPPPALLDGYALPPGTTMTVRLTATVDDPITATSFINAARLMSDQQTTWITSRVTNAASGAIGMKLTKWTALATNWDYGVTNDYYVTIENTGSVTLVGLKLTDALPAGVTFASNSAAIVQFLAVTTNAFSETVSDGFGTASYNNNDGTTNWVGGWNEIGDNASAANGSVLVRTAGGTNALVFELTDADNDHVTRTNQLATLPGRVYTNMTLSFAYRREGWDNTDSMTFTISTNGFGGQSNQVYAINNRVGNDAAWTNVTTDLTAFIGSRTSIALRVRAGPNFGAGDRINFDFITFTNSGYEVSTNPVPDYSANVAVSVVSNLTANPTNLLVNYTLAPGTSVSVRVRATLDVPLVSTQFVNTATATNAQTPPASALVTNYSAANAVGNYVWSDANGNGVQTNTEVGLTGVVVRIYDSVSNLLMTTTSGVAGAYAFTNLPTGSYFLEFVTPPGYLPTVQDAGGDDALDSDIHTNTGRTATFALSGGTNDTSRDAGYYQPSSSIGNFIWRDVNGNGVQNGGAETGMPGVVVTLYDGSSNVVGVTTSSAAGAYGFTNLPTSYYFLQFAAPTNFTFTLQGQGSDDAVDSDASPVNGRTALFYLPPGTNDTRWDAGLSPIVYGLRLAKTSNAGSCLAASNAITYTMVIQNTGTVTQAGIVLYDPLPAGLAYVTGSVTWVGGTLATAGPPPNLLVNLTLTNNQSATVTVQAVVSAPSSVTQLLNTASTYSAVQPAIYASVTNCVQSADVGVQKSVTTNAPDQVQIIEYVLVATNRGPDTATGVKITDVLPTAYVQYNSHSNGNYNAGTGIWDIGTLGLYASTTLYVNVTVRENTAGVQITNTATITGRDLYDPIPSNDTSAVVIVPKGGAVVGDRAWFDPNGNGIQDTGETLGITNLTVMLVNTNGTVVKTTNTDSAGYYLFANVVPGTYLIRFDLTGVSTNVGVVVANAGGDAALDSNVTNGNTGAMADTGLFALQSGATNLTIDLGLARRGSTRAEIAEVWGEWTGGEGRVGWRTSSEWNTAGFFVYRVDPETGAETRVSDRLAPSLFQEGGAVYELSDPEAGEGEERTYRLEEVELSGQILDLGAHPVVFGPPPPAAKAARAETRVLAKAAGASLKLSGAKRAGPSSLLKVLYRAEGLYGVSLQDIAAGMGRDLEDAEALAVAGSLRFVSEGRPVPTLYDEARARLVFHGQPTHNWYTRDNAVLISEGEGATMPRREPGASEGASVFPVTVRFEQDRYPFDSSAVLPEDFYYWDYVLSGDPTTGARNFPLDLAGRTGSVALKVRLMGWSSTASDPDHLAEIQFNGSVVGSFTFDGQDAVEAELEIPPGSVSNGVNTLTVKGVLPAGRTHSFFVVDWIEASFERELAPISGTAFFRAGGEESVSAGAFTEPLAVALDEEGSPIWIADENGALPDKSWAVASGNERFAVIEAGEVPLLTSEPVLADPWFLAETNRVDYLVVVSRALESTVRELADYRAGQGLRVGVAVFEDLCDWMVGGLRTPEAIPELLSYAASAWATAPRMVVLAGNGHYDYLGALSNEVNHLPPMMLQTQDGIFAADGLLADAGGDPLPDVAIGRLPALTAADLAAMIAKIKAYESESDSGWQRTLVFANDAADVAAGNFASANEKMAALAGDDFTVERIDLDTTAINVAVPALLARFNAGAGLIHYTGHGGVANWSSKGLLKKAHVDAMNNVPKPVVVALSCLVGRFEAPGPNAQSLGELLLRRAQGGAVAAWGPSGLSRNDPAVELGEAFYSAVLQEGAGTLGLAVLRAIRSQESDLFTQDTRTVYNLLGDPALRIAGNAETNGTKSAAQIVLRDLAQTYDGTARAVAATTEPAGLAVEFTYDGLATAPTAVGSYAVVATIHDEDYEGSASGTLMIGKAEQTIDFPEIGDPTTADAVGLLATASSGLPVSFAVGSGPATISGGTNLSFTGAGSVSVVASQPGDGNWNAAAEVVRTFTVVLPAPLLVFSRTNVNVRENGEGRFFVRLDRAPETVIPVSVARSAGDESLTAQSGAALTVGPNNWNLWQAVTLAAAEDANADGEMATFRISAPGVAERFVTAAALDDDIGTNWALAAGGATISGTLATKPEWLIDGVHASSANYGYTCWTNEPPGTMTLDLQAATTVARIRLLNWDWSCRTHQYRIEASLNGSSWTTVVDAGASEQRGWEEWTVDDAPARYLRFTGVSNSANRYVCVAELEVYGVAVPLPQAEVSTDNVNVREAGEGRFYVRLDREPLANVTVGVSFFSGDAGLSVKSGASRTFTPTNWSTWQVVTLQADADADADNETATFRLAGTGLEAGYLEATALDDDIGTNLALASSGATISGTLATKPEWLIDGVHTSSANYGYTCWTNEPPGTMTLDLQEATTVARIRLLNWDWGYRTHQYRIESSLDGADWTTVVDAGTSAQRGWEDWAVADEPARYLRFTGVSNSANRYVCIAEWEVYEGAPLPMAKSIRRTDAEEKSSVSAAPAAAAWEDPENGVATVVTGDDGPEHTNGWAAVDGDANTLWAGEAGAGGWYIAVGYASTLTVTNLAVDLAEGSLTDFRCLHSLDGVDWSELPGEFGGRSFELNYLWLLFPGDGTAAVPRVVEIEPQE